MSVARLTVSLVEEDILMKQILTNKEAWEIACVENYPDVVIRAVGGGRHEAVTPHDDELVGAYSVIRGDGWIK